MHRPAVRRPRPGSNPTGSRIGIAAVAVVALLAMMPALGIPPAHASGPVAQLTPTELTFPATPTGSRSETQSVTLTNAGDGPLTVHSVRTAALGSSSPFEIMANDCTGRSLGVGEACTVDIAFQPDTAGGVTGELTFAHDAPGSPHIVALSGQGLAAYPVAKASPRVVEFGTIGEYFESQPETVTLTNTGESTLMVKMVRLEGPEYADYRIVSNSCQTHWSLEPGESCQVDVSFQPTGPDHRFGLLNFYTNDPRSPEHAILSGYGAPAVLELSPTALDFGDQEAGTRSSPRMVTISNTGTGRAHISSIEERGTNPDEFSSAFCYGWLEPGESCQLAIWFLPMALGPRAAWLEIAHSASGSPLNIPLTGAGVRTGRLNLKGPGNAFTTGDGSKATLAVASGGRATFQVRVSNDGPEARIFRLSYASTQTPAVVRMFKPGLVPKELTSPHAGAYWTPSIPAGGSTLIDVTVAPTSRVQSVSGVEVRLEGAREVLLDRVLTETNIKAPSAGTDAFGLFVKENSQPFVGGSVDGQTATAPSTPKAGIARFTAQLRNDTTTRTVVRFSLAAASNPCWSAKVTVKEGIRTVDITGAVFGSGYERSIAGGGTSVQIAIAVTRLASNCTAAVYSARTWGDADPGHRSYLLVNPSV